MELHGKLTYDDIKEAKKITIVQDMIVRMNKYYNPIQSKISYDFKTKTGSSYRTGFNLYYSLWFLT